MRSFSSSFACRQPRRATKPTADITAWARDLVARPERYGATERERAIVAGLLRDIEMAR